MSLRITPRRLAVAGLGLTALLVAPAAHAQANLIFSGGSGSPLSLALVNPVTYTVTTTASTAPLFVFQGVGNLFSRNVLLVTGNITYRINSGATQTLDTISSGLTFGSITSNDVYINPTSFPGVTAGNVVTLLSGTLTTNDNVAASAPINRAYTTFLIDNNTVARISANGVAGGAAAPEPGSLALALPLVVGGGIGLVRRRGAGA